MRPTRSRARGTSLIASKPCQTSARAPLGAATTRPSTETRASKAAETTRAAAAATKTASTLIKVTSSPAASGPSKVPRLSIVEVAPFAAISSRAVRARDGSSAISAGRNSVEQTPTSDPATNTIVRSSIAAPMAEMTSAAAPSRTRASRNRSRRKRSPKEAANGAIAAAGSRRRRPATPTAVEPPWPYANTPSATKCAHSADISAPQASSARRMSTLRAAMRSAPSASRERDARRLNPPPSPCATRASLSYAPCDSNSAALHAGKSSAEAPIASSRHPVAQGDCCSW